jgi:hypothetical protein
LSGSVCKSTRKGTPPRDAVICGGVAPVTLAVTEAESMSITGFPASISEATDSSSRVMLAENVASVEREFEYGSVSSTTSSIGMLSCSAPFSQLKRKVL